MAATPQRVTVREAAVRLGISEGAVRMRIKRGTLDSTRAHDRLYVLLDAEPHNDPTRSDTDRLISTLEEQLREEREARRRADTLLAQLTQSNTALHERLRELESSVSPPGVQSEHGDTDVPPASLKYSGLKVTEGVAVAVVTTAILAAAKVIIPLIVGVSALAVAGVSAINGDFVKSLISSVLGSVSVLLAVILYRLTEDHLRRHPPSPPSEPQTSPEEETPVERPWWRRVFR